MNGVCSMRATRGHRRFTVLGAISLTAGLFLSHAPTAACQRPDSAAVAAAGAVGMAFLNAVRAADWKAAAAFLDVVPLDHYRLAQIDMVRRIRSQPPMT